MDDVELLVRVIAASKPDATPEEVRRLYLRAQVLILTHRGHDVATIAERTFVSERMVSSIIDEHRSVPTTTNPKKRGQG